MGELVDKLIEKDLERARKTKFRRKSYTVKKEGLVWDVVFTDIKWPAKCPVLGIELDYYSERQSDHSPFLSLINKKQGYVKDNVVVVSHRVKRLASDGSATEHRQIADYLDMYL